MVFSWHSSKIEVLAINGRMLEMKDSVQKSSNENWSRGPTVDKFCAGTCACQLRFYGDPGLTKVLPGPTVA
jgi:hypothetical protein